ncbi:hypothetical protein BFW01_g7423 [Lasiodiplodia theobromae]|uniref:Trans-enoyl reductase lepG n=1 Tax=Lasiodiplodia theobromae TaxID=45133 RepID=A0A5N5D179_9PEZI|nr:Trans-enoyl reductase lepG [Lasiodiplodia theobromae]KAF9636527.1 hypothetical protein BFW01_g7423 [Lasiodiplodia theobromae]
MVATANTQRAIKIQAPGKVALQENCPIPVPQADEVLVKVVCVALNPVDAKSADLSPTPGATSGCDFSGEVVSIGDKVKQPLSVADRVCGCVFGNNPDELQNGAFAEYVAVPGDLLFRIPEGMSFQTAATLGVGVSTAGMALYQTLKLPLPNTPASSPQFVLIAGGGTATGSLAIQLAKLSGMIPIATCSPRSFDRVKSLGAAEAFDYHSPTCGADIREFTKNTLEYALDCITDTGSMNICYAAISKSGGKYVALDPFPIRSHTRRSVVPAWIVAFTIFNKPVNWQRPFKREARPKDREFGEAWFQTAQKLLDENLIRAHPQEERPGGFEGVIDGLDDVRKGQVSGVKLVYKI